MAPLIKRSSVGGLRDAYMRAQQPTSTSREDPEERSDSDDDSSASSASEVSTGEGDDPGTSEHSRGGPLAAHQVHRLSDLVEVDEESGDTTGFIQTAATSDSATADEPKVIEMAQKPGIHSIFAFDPSYYHETADGIDLPPWLPPPSSSASSMSAWGSQGRNTTASQNVICETNDNDEDDKYLARVDCGKPVLHRAGHTVTPLQVSLEDGDFDNSQDVSDDDDDSEESRIEPWTAPFGYKNPPRLIEQTSASWVSSNRQRRAGSYDETEQENDTSNGCAQDTPDQTSGRLNAGYASGGNMQGYSHSTPSTAAHHYINPTSPTQTSFATGTTAGAQESSFKSSRFTASWMSGMKSIKSKVRNFCGRGLGRAGTGKGHPQDSLTGCHTASDGSTSACPSLKYTPSMTSSHVSLSRDFVTQGGSEGSGVSGVANYCDSVFGMTRDQSADQPSTAGSSPHTALSSLQDCDDIDLYSKRHGENSSTHAALTAYTHQARQFIEKGTILPEKSALLYSLAKAHRHNAVRGTSGGAAGACTEQVSAAMSGLLGEATGEATDTTASRGVSGGLANGHREQQLTTVGWL